MMNFSSNLRSKKPTERIFVHKNLLISLALGHLVYVFDIKVLTSRSELRTGP